MSTVAVPTNKFSWLLKREFWEYRGAFFWTPAIVSAVMLAFVILAIVIAEASASRAGLNLNGIRFDEISRHLSEGNMTQLHAGLDVGLHMQQNRVVYCPTTKLDRRSICDVLLLNGNSAQIDVGRLRH